MYLDDMIAKENKAAKWKKKPDIFTVMKKLKPRKKKPVNASAEDIVQFYSQVGCESREMKIPNLVNDDDYDTDLNERLNRRITYGEVVDAIRHFRKGARSKCFGSDMIHPLMVSEQLADVFLDIFNEAFDCGMVR